MKGLKKYSTLILFLVILLVIMPLTFSYEVDPPGTVHQHITNESQITWKLAPPEMKNYISNPLNTNINDGNGFDPEDDIIDGSGEEDKGPEYLPFFRHFLEPDNPNSVACCLEGKIVK